MFLKPWMSLVRFAITIVVFLLGWSAVTHAELRISTYMTARSVERFHENVESREQGLQKLKSFDISKVILEVYRSGVVVPPDTLAAVRGYLEQHGYDVWGGIATVPGGGFGVRQEGPLGWFNWEAEKTQEDLKEVMRNIAPIFDTFIVDDFLCTGDVSEQSKKAKDEQSWSGYRRDLMVRMAREVFVEPAKDVNPDIHMVVKFPQWYDRFHLFGYDVPRMSDLFDAVWVGTETRGARTQRFGFVQPYEGFVNYRWIESIAGGKVEGAWFDHGDTEGDDFLEQAYQTVLAGAPDIVLFNFHNLMEEHPGHELLREHLPELKKLAAAVAEHPVTGIHAYKPPNSDAGGDLYVMDFLGMLGIPLIPTASFPAEAHTIFLPTQAAADSNAAGKIRSAIDEGVRVIMTTGFLSAVPDTGELARLCGLRGIVEGEPITATHAAIGQSPIEVEHGLHLAAGLAPGDAEVRLEAAVDGRRVPVLTEYRRNESHVFVLNTHTYSQADFEAVGEVLLAPRPLGLLEIPRVWANEIRRAFNGKLDYTFDAPARVALQPLGKDSWVIHNYKESPTFVVLKEASGAGPEYSNAFTSEPLETKPHGVVVRMEPRSRVWIQRR